MVKNTFVCAVEDEPDSPLPGVHRARTEGHRRAGARRLLDLEPLAEAGGAESTTATAAAGACSKGRALAGWP